MTFSYLSLTILTSSFLLIFPAYVLVRLLLAAVCSPCNSLRNTHSQTKISLMLRILDLVSLAHLTVVNGKVFILLFSSNLHVKNRSLFLTFCVLILILVIRLFIHYIIFFIIMGSKSKFTNFRGQIFSHLIWVLEWVCNEFVMRL